MVHSQVKRPFSSDTGALVVQQVIAIAVGIALAVLGTIALVNYANTSKGANDLQAADSSISRALDTIDNSVDTADKALYASKNDLVLQSTVNGANVLTRWVVSGDKFYRQQWDGQSGTYTHANAWIAPTAGEGPAPSGEGTQVSVPVISNLRPQTHLAYTDPDGHPIDLAAGVEGVNIPAIGQVHTVIEGSVNASGQGFLENRKVSVLGAKKMSPGVIIGDPADVPEPAAPSLGGVTAAPTPTPTATATPTAPTPTPTAPTPTAPTTAPPTVPPLPTLACPAPNVKVLNGDLVVSWNAVTGATSYKITRDGITAGTTTKVTFTDTVASTTKKTVYKVIPVAGGWKSPTNCTTVTFTPPPAPPAKKPIMACAAPTLKVVNSKIVVSWPKVTGATTYKVMRGTVLVGNTSSLTMTDPVANPKTAYTYKVTPSGAGYDPAIGCASVSYKPGALNCPPSPKATLVGNSVVVSFGKVTGATSYKIMRGTTVAGTTTSLTFTDTAANKALSYKYTVIPVSTSKTSPTCAAITYTPPLSKPKFLNSYVGITGTLPTSWDGTQNQPSLAVAWGKVANATSYKLEYRTLNASGVEVLSWRTAVTTTALSHKVPAASFNHTYQWRVTALSAKDSAISTTMDMLTHPVAATGLGTKAAYVDTTKGKNVVSWNKVIGADGYHIYKKVGSVNTKVATVTGEATLSWTHESVAYGTTTEYWVAPYNDGARGVSSTGVVVKGQRSAPAPGKSTLQKTALKKQLQYPAIPSIKAINKTNLASGSQDLNLKNVVRWNAVTSATKYQVERRGWNGSTPACLTGTNCDSTVSSQGSGTSFTDTAVKAGSQHRYVVTSINATGLSYKESAIVLLTQRPAKPSITRNLSPTLSANSIKYTVGHNGDAATPGFCGSTTCSLDVVEKVSKETETKVYTKNRPDKGLATDVFIGSAAWGDTNNATVVSKNPATYNGGKSDVATIQFKHYPGPFSVSSKRGDKDGDNAYRIHVEQRKYDGKVKGSVDSGGDLRTRDYSNGGSPDDDTREHYQWGKVYGSWSSSGGVKTNGYAVSYITSNASYSSDSSKMLPTKAELKGSKALDSAGGWTISDASPGAHYKFTVKVTARSGLTRSASSSVFTRMDIPRKTTFKLICSGTAPFMYQGGPEPHEDYPSQRANLMATSSNVDTLYGADGTATIRGYYRLDSGSWKHRGWHNSTSSFTTYASSVGVSYKYMYTYGFELKTMGSGDYPDSPTLRLVNSHIAQFQVGCAARGITDPAKMKEPGDACYGYTAADKRCWSIKYRPHLAAK